MTEEEFDPRQFWETLRKTASVKAGAVMFGEAQVAYYDTLTERMSEEQAYNMLAHTTECMVRGIAEAAGPVSQALLQASYVWQKLSTGESGPNDKTVPGR